jgi:competence protein ComEC
VTPIVRFTLLFCVGILGGLRGIAGPQPLLWAAATGALLVVAALLAPAQRRHGVLLAFVAAGLAHGAAARNGALSHCLAVLPDNARLTVDARVVALSGGDGTTVPLALERAAVGDVAVPCDAEIRVRWPRSAEAPPEVGAPVRLAGRWRARPRFDAWPARGERAGSFAADSVLAQGGGTDRVLAVRGGAQRRLRILFPERWPLAEALLLARREGLDPAVRERFVAAGMTHLLAISGTHVGLFAGCLLLGLRMARVRLQPAIAAAALASVLYVLFIGAPHAAARAALQLVLFSAARLMQRAVDAVSVVAVAALTLLAVDAHALLEPGFQLSFAGVLGIVRLRRPTLALLPERLPGALRDALAAGIAATIPTLPIAALHFQQAAPIGLVASIVATPIVACAIPAVILMLALHPLLPGLAVFLAGGVELLLVALDGVAGAAAAVPGGHAYVTPQTVLGGVAAAAAFVLLGRHERLRAAAGGGTRGAGQHGRRARLLPARPLVGAALCACLLPALLPRLPGRGVEIHTLDVGQGDAIAIRTPRGRWILIDAGDATPTFDAGARTVVPFLRAQGARRLDALILTHPHADHIGGAAAVLGALRVSAVVDPGAPAPSASYLRVIEAARAGGAAWIAARPERVLRIDGITFEFLHPDERALDALLEPNDYSAVFLVRYGRFGALFLGDAPAWVENALVRRYGAELAADVIKAGHHGSRTSSGDSLLAAVAPKLALISAGRRNRHGHPSPEVMERLDRYGIRTLRTDSAGTILLRVGPDGRFTQGGGR